MKTWENKQRLALEILKEFCNKSHDINKREAINKIISQLELLFMVHDTELLFGRVKS